MTPQFRHELERGVQSSAAGRVPTRRCRHQTRDVPCPLHQPRDFPVSTGHRAPSSPPTRHYGTGPAVQRPAAVGREPYWYQGERRTQRSWMPASVLILMLAASVARTVSFTDCIRFWALPTSMSVASWSSSVPAGPSHRMSGDECNNNNNNNNNKTHLYQT